MRWLSRLLVVVVMGLAGISFAGTYGGGSGTEEDPYQIADVNDLLELRTTPDDYDKCFVLTADIDLGAHSFTTAVFAPDTPDTSSTFDGVSFTGIFDGNGHVISNLNIDTAFANNYYLGLFGRINYSSAEIKNLGMENTNITGGDISDYLGGLCGENWNGKITNCYSKGSVGGNNYLGGLCGRNGGTITHCHGNSLISGNAFLGGLCGQNYSGTITNSYSGGLVDGYRCLGGLCGWNEGGTITNCYSGGSVLGGDLLGGLCGYNVSGTITKCYANGMVRGRLYAFKVGGLCGENQDGIINNCFWDTESSGVANSGGGTGLITAQIQMLSTFGDAGWDFTNTWNIGENQTYPYLRTYSAADINKDRVVNVIDLSIMGEQWMRQ